MFLGLMQDGPKRKEVLAELCFAGLIDVQDRLLYNRSYTTGHKAIARAPRWRSAMRSAGPMPHARDLCRRAGYRGGTALVFHIRNGLQLVKMKIEGEALHAVPYGGVSEAELAVLRNTGRR